jgi:hypothetical protein
MMSSGRRKSGAAPIGEDIIMGRKFIDCREFPSERNCSIAIVADTENELLEAAIQHATSVHGHQDTPEFREMLRQTIHEGTPELNAPPQRA